MGQLESDPSNRLDLGLETHMNQVEKLIKSNQVLN